MGRGWKPFQGVLSKMFLPQLCNHRQDNCNGKKTERHRKLRQSIGQWNKSAWLAWSLGTKADSNTAPKDNVNNTSWHDDLQNKTVQVKRFFSLYNRQREKKYCKIWLSNLMPNWAALIWRSKNATKIMGCFINASQYWLRLWNKSWRGLLTGWPVLGCE